MLNYIYSRDTATRKRIMLAFCAVFETMGACSKPLQDVGEPEAVEAFPAPQHTKTVKPSPPVSPHHCHMLGHSPSFELL